MFSRRIFISVPTDAYILWYLFAVSGHKYEGYTLDFGLHTVPSKDIIIGRGSSIRPQTGVCCIVSFLVNPSMMAICSIYEMD